VKIIWTRRLCQGILLVLFFWFCWVAVWGDKYWQLRGWPVNLFLELDPLASLMTLLTTGILYKGLLLGWVVLGLTVLLGRFFCGWICPLGTLQQVFGWLGSCLKSRREKIESNKYRGFQIIKYYILVVLIVVALLPFEGFRLLLSGIFDPISLAHRSIYFSFGYWADVTQISNSVTPRLYSQAGVIALLFFGILITCWWLPRFYCRFICPAGALMGLFSRYAIWRIGKKEPKCSSCQLCNNYCEGACDPFGKIHIHDCLLCMNCLDACNQKSMGYQTKLSASGEITNPDLTRRGLLISMASGALLIPAIHIDGAFKQNWNANLIRPPGTLPENEFLKRCIRCGQCMKICPPNIIMPDGFINGPESLWTPILNFRIGTSGCQINCVACSHICPTGAIRPLTLDEKNGSGRYQDKGPIRIGTAFVDKGRCLPWSMNRPCLVCQENCPISPKAIKTVDYYQMLPDQSGQVFQINGNEIKFKGSIIQPASLNTGDYYLKTRNGTRYRISDNTDFTITLESAGGKERGIAIKNGDAFDIEILLHAPMVDVNLCVGCGTCEHECPVSGLRAIRVTADNETRNDKHSFSVRRKTNG